MTAYQHSDFGWHFGSRSAPHFWPASRWENVFCANGRGVWGGSGVAKNLIERASSDPMLNHAKLGINIPGDRNHSRDFWFRRNRGDGGRHRTDPVLRFYCDFCNIADLWAGTGTRRALK